MLQPTMTSQSLLQNIARIAPRIGYLTVVAMLLAVAVFFLAEGIASTAAILTAATLAMIATFALWFSLRQDSADMKLQAQIAAFIRHEPLVCFITDTEGQITAQNRVAHDRFQIATGQTLAHTLSGVLASPAAVTSRLKIKAQATGAAQEDIVTRRGHVRLTAQRIGEQGFLWRFDDIAERFPAGRGADSISLPMLTASHTGTILFMNEAMKRLIGRSNRSTGYSPICRCDPAMNMRSPALTARSGFSSHQAKTPPAAGKFSCCQPGPGKKNSSVIQPPLMRFPWPCCACRATAMCARPTARHATCSAG